MNIPKSLTKVSAIGALALNSVACDPGRCDVIPEKDGSHALYDARAVYDACDRTHDDLITCLVISGNGKRINQMQTACDDPNLYSTLTDTFDEHEEGDDESTRACYMGGATVSCTD
jgi:hypothetical protein